MLMKLAPHSIIRCLRIRNGWLIHYPKTASVDILTSRGSILVAFDYGYVNSKLF